MHSATVSLQDGWHPSLSSRPEMPHPAFAFSDAKDAYAKAHKLDPKMEEYEQSAEKAAAAEQKALAEGAGGVVELTEEAGSRWSGACLLRHIHSRSRRGEAKMTPCATTLARSQGPSASGKRPSRQRRSRRRRHRQRRGQPAPPASRGQQPQQPAGRLWGSAQLRRNRSPQGLGRSP